MTPELLLFPWFLLCEAVRIPVSFCVVETGFLGVLCLPDAAEDSLPCFSPNTQTGFDLQNRLSHIN